MLAVQSLVWCFYWEWIQKYVAGLSCISHALFLGIELVSGGCFAYFADDSTTETERFLQYFDCFLDGMNVCCFTVFWTLETDLRPYHSAKDDCLKVTNSGIIHAVTWSHTHTYTYAIHSTHTCTQWLKECQISTDQWEDFTNAQKQIMCLSKETLLGLQMTGLLTAYKHCCYKWNVNITFL